MQRWLAYAMITTGVIVLVGLIGYSSSTGIDLGNQLLEGAAFDVTPAELPREIEVDEPPMQFIVWLDDGETVANVTVVTEAGNDIFEPCAANCEGEYGTYSAGQFQADESGTYLLNYSSDAVITVEWTELPAEGEETRNAIVSWGAGAVAFGAIGMVGVGVVSLGNSSQR